MADTVTTTLGLTKPEVGASEDSWGEKINTNFDLVDDALDGTTAVSLDINGGTIDGAVIGGATPAAITGTAITGTSFATSGDMTFGDNDKAIFGAGSDLQIYHDGTTSFISDQGTGNLKILAQNFIVSNPANTETMIAASPDGAASLYYDSAVKIATTATGVDITGTLTSDGLTVDGTTNLQGTNPDLYFIESDTTDLNAYIANGSGNFTTYTANDAKSVFKTRINLDHSTGDISFYEDTGTTPKFFWDASLEFLGLGTTSPDTNLHVYHATRNNVAVFESGDADVSVYLRDGNSTSISAVGIGASTDDLTFRSGNAERMRIDSSGNVGIGTSSPSSYFSGATDLVISGSGESGVTIASGTSGAGRIHFADGTSGDAQYRGYIVYAHSGDSLQIATAGSERMRIDSSGNLLVGTTTEGTWSANNSSILRPSGVSTFTSTSTPPLYANRLSTDGTIIDIRKDGTTVGSIASSGGTDLAIGSGDTGFRFIASANEIIPWNASGNTTNGDAIDIGKDTQRFKDLYLSGGVYLGGTGSANKLDDYEEGTWTPSLVGSTTAGTATFVTGPTGTYTKVGNLVTVYFAWNISAHTGAGALRVNGLPFTGTTSGYGTVLDGNYNYTSGTKLLAYTAGAVLRFYQTGDNIGYTENTLDVSHQMNGSVTYRV